MNYPKALFRAPGEEVIEGHRVTSRVVKTADEHEAALADGWHETVDAAASDPQDNKPPTRAELETKAVELGINFKPSTSDKKLAANIAAKLAAGN